MTESRPASWPGFSGSGSVILPLERTEFAHDVRQLCWKGIEFQPKPELHVTLINRDLASRLLKRSSRELLEADLVKLFESLNWGWRATGERWLLRKADPGEASVHSIIELIEMEALNDFRSAIQDQMGSPVPHVPPHVTLYCAGSKFGIGLDSDAQFEERRVERV